VLLDAEPEGAVLLDAEAVRVRDTVARALRELEAVAVGMVPGFTCTAMRPSEMTTVASSEVTRCDKIPDLDVRASVLKSPAGYSSSLLRE
jgi:hypothetical protein